MRLASALIAAVGLLAASTAMAAPTWLGPSKLSASGASAEKPQVTVDPSGDAVAVWERPDAKTANHVIEVASRPAGTGGWQPAQRLSNSSLQASEPQVATDAVGDAVAVWLSFDGAEYSYLAASRSGLAGAWSSPATLATVGMTAPMEPRPDAAMNAAGDAVIVWERSSGSEGVVESVFRARGALSFGKPETIAKSAEDLHPPEVAIDGAGAATAVWEAKGGPVRIAAAERLAGAGWQAPVMLSQETGGANEPRIAVNSAGQAVAVWERFDNEANEELVEAAGRPGSGAGWGKSVAITKPEATKGEPAGQQVAIDAAGRAVATWSRTTSNKDVVEAALGTPSAGHWGAPFALSAPAGLTEEAPSVSVDDAGAAIVVWEQWAGAKKVIEAASGTSSEGAWRPAVALSAEGGEDDEAQVAIDSQGNAASVWRRFDGSDYLTEAAGFDAAGPSLNSLAIPAGGAVGQPVAFSVSPFDDWSALGATSWSLGDGTSQAGTSITHTYSAAGQYTVTVASTDALGNTTSARGVLSIAAVAPRISAATLTHRRFRVARNATAISAKARLALGTSFRFNLSQTASVRITFTKAVAGLRSGRRCVAPSHRLRSHHARRCTRTLVVGRLTRATEHQGADAIAFSGRIGRRALRAGSYRATLSATSAGLTSSPVTLALTVVH